MKHRSTQRNALLHTSSPERRTKQIRRKRPRMLSYRAGVRAAKGLNDGHGQIMAIWANEGMGMVTTTYL
jgi:hypothetical protein